MTRRGFHNRGLSHCGVGVENVWLAGVSRRLAVIAHTCYALPVSRITAPRRVVRLTVGDSSVALENVLAVEELEFRVGGRSLKVMVRARSASDMQDGALRINAGFLTAFPQQPSAEPEARQRRRQSPAHDIPATGCSVPIEKV